MEKFSNLPTFRNKQQDYCLSAILEMHYNYRDSLRASISLISKKTLARMQEYHCSIELDNE